MNATRWLSCAVAAALLLASATPAPAQTSGAGATGAQILQLPASARAAALAGAYTGATAADAVFYNPAGAAAIHAGASFSYQSLFEGIAIGAGSAVFRLGRYSIGASAGFLHSGEIAELVPDPEFGGQRGIATGNSFTAGESVLRLHLATTTANNLRFGGAVGLISSDIAGLSSFAPTIDLGAQLESGQVTFGAALRHMGGSLAGSGVEPAPLPTEARAGLNYMLHAPAGLGANIAADLVTNIRERRTSLLAGLEIGLIPGPGRETGLVARLGLSSAGTGETGIGPLHFGAGLDRDRIAVDYALQNLGFFGFVHRISIRWTDRRS